MTEQVASSTPADAKTALAELADALRDCQGCGLAAGRTQVVFGAGDANAELMFVGEGPGFHEDRQGIPFIGQAGKLLNGLLEQIGLTREQVYIANVVKCRPPDNRDPAEKEIAACSPHLMKQIEIIRPRVLCTLGRFATKLLTKTDLSMTAIHGRAKPMTLAGVEMVVFPVFHPAAALYTPANRVVLEEDFAKLKHLLDRGMDALSAGKVEGGEADTAETSPPTPTFPASSPATPASSSRRTSGAGSGEAEQLPLW